MSYAVSFSVVAMFGSYFVILSGFLCGISDSPVLFVDTVCYSELLVFIC